MKDKVLLITDKGIALSLLGFVASLPVSITATQGFFLLGLLLWIVKSAISDQQSVFSILQSAIGNRQSAIKKMDGLKWGILLFFLAGILSTIFSMDPQQSLFELRNFVFLLIVYFVGNHVRGIGELKKLLHLLISFSTLTALIGIGQALLGIDRAVGPQAIPQTFSEILILVLSLTWSLVLYYAKGKEQMILFIEAVLLSTALVLTYTRGAWLGLFATLGTLFLLCLKKRLPGMSLLRQAGMPVLLIFLYLLVFFFPRPVAERTQSIGDVEDSSNAIRLFMWKKSPEILQDYPITGVGLIDLIPIYDLYIAPETSPNLKHFRLGHFHNNFIQVMVQMGLLGLTTFLFLWFNIIRREYKIFCQIHHSSFIIHHSILLGTLPAVAGFLVSGLFEYNFGDSEVVMLLFFTVGIALAVERINNHEQSNRL